MRAEALFSLRVLLAGVLALAGAAKLRDRVSFETFLVRQRAPLPSAIARALPPLELLLAVGLLVGATARIAIALSLGTLVLFTLVLTRAALRGDHEGCACFGDLMQLRGGWPAVVRTGAVAAIALTLALLDRDPLGLDMLSPGMMLPLGIVAAALGAAMVAREILALRRRVAELEGRLRARAGDHNGNGTGRIPAALRAGAAAPAFSVIDLAGHRHTLQDLLALRRRIMVVFADVRCGPCRALLPRLQSWEKSHPHLVFAIIAHGARDDLAGWQREYGLGHIYQQDMAEIRDQYGIHGTPAALMIGASGLVERPVAAGVAAIEALVRGTGRASRRHEGGGALDSGAGAFRGSAAVSSPSQLKASADESIESLAVRPATAGARLADAVFQTQSGRPATLCTPGLRRLLVFWSESCLFCDELLDRMRQAGVGAREDSPAVTLVAVGPRHSPDLGRLPWEIVFDPDFASANTLGVLGTPSALLLAPDCTLEAPLATGAAAVAALAGIET